jgi:hypothetical protein
MGIRCRTDNLAASHSLAPSDFKITSFRNFSGLRDDTSAEASIATGRPENPREQLQATSVGARKCQVRGTRSAKFSLQQAEDAGSRKPLGIHMHIERERLVDFNRSQ